MKLPNLKFNLGKIIVLSLIECGLIGYIGFWREGFWNAVEQRNLHAFWTYLAWFSVAALLGCFVSGYNSYIQNYTSLIYRTKLTRKALKLNIKSLEGHGQRVQEDCFNYPQLIIGLSVGCFKNLVTVIVYLYILTIKLSLWYLLFPIIYIIIGTILASKIARPLINLNYVNQVFEAKFRQLLTKRSYSEVYRNNMNLFKYTKFLNYFQSFYNQITVVIPYIILWGLYSTSILTFGIFMQCASAMNEVISSLSGMINNFDNINRLRSCSRRLKEMEII